VYRTEVAIQKLVGPTAQLVPSHNSRALSHSPSPENKDSIVRLETLPDSSTTSLSYINFDLSEYYFFHFTLQSFSTSCRLYYTIHAHCVHKKWSP